MAKASTSKSEEQGRVIWSLRRAELAVQSTKERELRPIGLTASHYTLLASIGAEPGLAGATLARRLNVSPQAIASLVSRLERRGFVERRVHERHTQVQELHLTPSGRESLRQAEETMQALEQRVIDLIGIDQVANLRSVLDHLADALREP